MAKILILAETGFGKTISASGCYEPELGIDIKGLNPEETYFISVTSKPLPRRGSNKLYPVVYPVLNSGIEAMKNVLYYGRRVITTDGYLVAQVIDALNATPIKNIVIDDSNYLMQDFMMEKSLQTGWDAPKKAGHFMSKVFAAMERGGHLGKNFFMLAHYESYKKNNSEEISFKMKTTGNTVGNNITPEGKFDITLFGMVEADVKAKTATRYYLTNHDGTFPAKSPPGVFPSLRIPNDLGYVLECIEAYYNGEDAPVGRIIEPENTGNIPYVTEIKPESPPEPEVKAE